MFRIYKVGLHKSPHFWFVGSAIILLLLAVLLIHFNGAKYAGKEDVHVDYDVVLCSRVRDERHGSALPRFRVPCQN